MKRLLSMTALLLGLTALASPILPDSAAQAQRRFDRSKISGAARPNINRPAARPLPAVNNGNPRGWGNNNRPGRPGWNNNRPDVVVINRPGGGYYDGGRYHGRHDWDDDGDNFLEFVGKTAAITAGVSAVSAIIGSIVKDKPDQCSEPNAYGQVYCNGVWYQPVPNNGGYQVVPPPQQ